MNAERTILAPITSRRVLFRDWAIDRSREGGETFRKCRGKTMSSLNGRLDEPLWHSRYISSRLFLVSNA